jgi:ubiquitin C-terminal hydrolase
MLMMKKTSNNVTKSGTCDATLVLDASDAHIDPENALMEVGSIPLPKIKVTYSLVRIIQHKPSGNGGHYTLKVKRNGVWYLIDDENVSKITEGTEQDNEQNCPYLVIYEATTIWNKTTNQDTNFKFPSSARN